MKNFHGESTLKTWIYRIAVHEASNRRRWWFRHKARETSIDQGGKDSDWSSAAPQVELVSAQESPFDRLVHGEVKVRVEQELRRVPEPYRTTLILRDLEEMSYDEIAEITGTTLGTVKSRLTRGREALKQRLADYIRQVGPELGSQVPETQHQVRSASSLHASGQLEVTS
jgi:RNA polymerase sigma-70 factor (ECF subfamily)